MLRYVIIGSGAAGISAAETIRRQDPSGEIFLLSEESDGYYSRPGLAYYLTGEIPERQLFPFQENDFKQQRLRIIVNRVIAIDPSNHQILIGNDKVMKYDRLLITTGSQATAESIHGAELDGVIKLDNINDAAVSWG
jgi:NADPH-dependent 2,4-dienoyl-CoA reductase/sulfur reductase-like enzyme